MSDDKKKSNLKTAKNVLFYYTSVEKPQKQLNKDNKPPLSDHDLEFHGYEVKILVTEKYFKAMKGSFKGAKNFPNVKEYTAAECVSKLGMEEEPDQDMILIKFTQGCLYGKKNNRKESRKVGLVGSKKSTNSDGKVSYFDNKGNVLTPETAIGNGSKGHLQFNPVENEFGLYLYPTAVCITELVEYVAPAQSFDEDAFGIEESDEFEADEPVAKSEEEEDDEFGDDPLF